MWQNNVDWEAVVFMVFMVCVTVISCFALVTCSGCTCGLAY